MLRHERLAVYQHPLDYCPTVPVQYRHNLYVIRSFDGTARPFRDKEGTDSKVEMTGPVDDAPDVQIDPGRHLVNKIPVGVPKIPMFPETHVNNIPHRCVGHMTGQPCYLVIQDCVVTLQQRPRSTGTVCNTTSRPRARAASVPRQRQATPQPGRLSPRRRGASPGGSLRHVLRTYALHHSAPQKLQPEPNG